MRRTIVYLVFLLNSSLFAIAPDDAWKQINSQQEQLLELNQQLKQHYLLLEELIPTTAEVGPKEVLRTIFFDLSNNIIKSRDAIKNYKNTFPKKSQKLKKKKKKTNLNNKKEQSIKKLNQLLDNTIKSLNKYIFLQVNFSSEFYRIIVQRGPYNDQTKTHIPLMFLKEDDAHKHYRKCHETVLNLIIPFDNYAKHVIDYLDSIAKTNTSIKIDSLAIDLTNRLDEELISMFSLKKEHLESLINDSSLASSRKNRMIEYIVFKKTDKQSDVYAIPFLQSRSINLAWFIDTANETSKLYINLSPAKNGLIFYFTDKKILFDFYISEDLIRHHGLWCSIDYTDKESLGLDSERVHKSFVPLLNACVYFIEYNDIARFQEILDEINLAGYLTQSVMQASIQWILENNVPIGAEIPPFYPKNLRKLKEAQERDHQNIVRTQSDRALEREFSSRALPTVRDYYGALEHTLNGPGSLNSRMFKKCMNWFLKREEKRYQKSRQKGSHLQLEGAQDEPTTTVVLPHGEKAKRGVKKSALRKWLE